MSNEIMQEAMLMFSEMVSWRRELHRIPELGLKLPQTTAFICGKLDEMGIKYKLSSESSCITALIGSGSPCFLLRSDMDALPVEEQSGEPFAADNGCCHACGHDLHATVLLGAAKLLKAHEAELKGTVKLLFQSGEETFTGCAAAISEGVLEDPHVDASFAAHVAGAVQLGVIAYGDKAMSSAYGFHIDVKGTGVHGSSPELGVDPINAAVHIYLALQEMIAREVSGMDEVAMTIGQFHAGGAANVIPDTAMMEGTLRTFKKETADFLIGRITEAAEKIAEAYRAKAEVTALYNVPPVDGDPEFNEACIASIKKVNSDVYPAKVLHAMGSEDFAFVTQRIPSGYMFFGAGVEDKSKWRPQHAPDIVFNENVIPLMTASYAQVAMDYLENHGE